jgi:hypothetical protein
MTSRAATTLATTTSAPASHALRPVITTAVYRKPTLLFPQKTR